MSHDHSAHCHSHGLSAALDAPSMALLAEGLSQLLTLTEGLEFRALPSEKHPNPLARMIYRDMPAAATVREDVKATLPSNPVAGLEQALALVELYESNQCESAEYVLDDMKFVGACFATKRASGWAAVLGDADRAGLEAAVNAKWQFRFVSAPARPTGIYSLLNRLARYAFVYGRVKYGDAHAATHFIEDFTPGVLICRGKLSPLELALSLAAMKMGVPAVVPPDYPFPLGRTLRLDALDDIRDSIVAFPNIRRLLDFPDFPKLPDYCSNENLDEKFTPAAVWGDSPESFFILRKGLPASTPVTVTGTPSGPMGIILTADAEPLDAFDRRYIERVISISPCLMKGVMSAFNGQRMLIKIAPGMALDPARIGEVLVASLKREFPKIHRVSAEVIFDRGRLAALVPEIREERRLRDAEIAATTEETMSHFVTCTGCSQFAPDHVCIVTHERPPQCSRQYEKLKTGAIYGYDDMTNIHHSALTRGLNSFGVVEKGRCVDHVRGEWAGVNAAAARLTGGRTRRIQLHAVEDFPTTGCGCFSMIMFQTDSPRPGIGIMDNAYEGRTPDGRSWKDLYYVLAGKQAPGLSGTAAAYLLSPKFLRAHGGWDAVVWVSPRVAAVAGKRLRARTMVGE